MSIQTLAAEAYGYRERKTRDNDESYVVVRDGAPEWIGELCQYAHGDMLPDDWRYGAIFAALGAIADLGDGADLDDYAHDFADGMVDTYNGARLAWLGSHLSRAGYCDEAAEDLGGSSDGITGAIALGQYAEALEVYGLVVDFLRDMDNQTRPMFVARFQWREPVLNRTLAEVKRVRALDAIEARAAVEHLYGADLYGPIEVEPDYSDPATRDWWNARMAAATDDCHAIDVSKLG